MYFFNSFINPKNALPLSTPDHIHNSNYNLNFNPTTCKSTRKPKKNCHWWFLLHYRVKIPVIPNISIFYLFFCGGLRTENKWVKFWKMTSTCRCRAESSSTSLSVNDFEKLHVIRERVYFLMEPLTFPQIEEKKEEKKKFNWKWDKY